MDFQETSRSSQSNVGFRNANSHQILSIPKILLDESRKRYAQMDKENILDPEKDAVRHKKTIKYRNGSRKLRMCPSYKPNEAPKRLCLRNKQNQSNNQKAYPKLPKIEMNSPATIKIMASKNNINVANPSKTLNLNNGQKDLDRMAKTNKEKPKELFKTPQGSIELSEEQKVILNHVLNGKNVFFTGCAGTGKSVLLREIWEKLRELGAETHVTASTGLAAFNIDGKTLHSWSGIGLGTSDAQNLIKKIKLNDQTLRRWRTTRVLIIDEISMIAGEIFDKLDLIARRVRSNQKPFGGIQLVLCGDFMQLPPVKAHKLVFEAAAWKRCVPATAMFELKTVFRQKDKRFIAMLNELRRGVLTPATEKILTQTAANKLPENSVEIHSHRATVSRRNAMELKRLPGKSHWYDAEDTSLQRLSPEHTKKLLASCPIPSQLTLKVGAPVIVMKNIDDVLVNGLAGVVRDFVPSEQNGELVPLVYFHRLGKIVQINKFKYSVVRGDDTVLASRRQLPLNLAWALTIHKCQGMTLDYAAMDLGSVWEPGQFYVAVSRLRSLDGLRIEGHFDGGCVKANPKVVAWMQNNRLLERAAAQGGNKRDRKGSDSSAARMAQISRPFLPPPGEPKSPLSFFQKRSQINKARRREAALSKSLSSLSKKHEEAARKRRFSITATDMEDFSSIMDSFEK